MIARLRGTIIEKEAKAIIVDVGGIGYRVAVMGTLRNAVHVDEKVDLHIHHQTNDDGQFLYGFSGLEDLQYFTLLLIVPSVGPRTAMNILDVAPPATLARAVNQGDVALLTKVSGVGKKTASRIVLELKGKIANLVEDASGMSGELQGEAVAALMSLGYTNSQAREAVSKIPEDITTVEEAIRAVLKANAS